MCKANTSNRVDENYTITNAPLLRNFRRTNRSHIRGATRVLVAKPEGEKPPGRITCRWEDNIKMDLK